MQIVEHTKWFILLKERNNGHITSTISHLFLCKSFIIRGTILLTLLATDPPPSRPKWVLLFSRFPHLCCVPTDSFYQSWVGQALFPPIPADRFWEDLDAGNFPFFCRAQPGLGKISVVRWQVRFPLTRWSEGQCLVFNYKISMLSMLSVFFIVKCASKCTCLCPCPYPCLHQCQFPCPSPYLCPDKCPLK